jgi:[citrate (pro-3S)-lyase] ligase
VKQFLAQHQLSIDPDIEYFVVAYCEQDIIACGGIAGHVLKSIAVSSMLQGEGFSLKLMTELTNFAYEMGRFHLFLFTKPANIALFRQSGFFLVERVGNDVALMENSPMRLQSYCQQLQLLKVSGGKIGSIVMNANPFTLGHQYLLEQACAQCDWVHLFAVREEGGDFTYADRLAMINAGTRHLNNISIHPGSDYIISKATFPTYFIKDQQVINSVHTELDLKIFRHYIAPALGITHRFVGSEPYCPVTRSYNQAMQEWLEKEYMNCPPIKVMEIMRCERDARPISATRVRQLLRACELPEVRTLVPNSTYSYLCQHYVDFVLSSQSRLASA